MMAACAELATVTGVAEACRILKIPRSSLYRLRKPVDKSPKPARERTKPQRALDDAEKETVRNRAQQRTIPRPESTRGLCHVAG